MARAATLLACLAALRGAHGFGNHAGEDDESGDDATYDPTAAACPNSLAAPLTCPPTAPTLFCDSPLLAVGDFCLATPRCVAGPTPCNTVMVTTRRRLDENVIGVYEVEALSTAPTADPTADPTATPASAPASTTMDDVGPPAVAGPLAETPSRTTSAPTTSTLARPSDEPPSTTFTTTSTAPPATPSAAPPATPSAAPPATPSAAPPTTWSSTSTTFFPWDWDDDYYYFYDSYAYDDDFSYGYDDDTYAYGNYYASSGPTVSAAPTVLRNSFYELFENRFDLAYQKVVFTPASAESYDLVVEPITELPFAPGGLSVSLMDDDGVSVPLAPPFTFYGETYSTMWVGSNGFLTFERRDTSYSNSFPKHFEQPRISILWRDLNPRNGGNVTFHTTAQGVHVVTFEAVPCWGSYCGPNTFQAALHQDGTIELAWTDVDANNGGYGAYGPLVGISGGVEPATDEQTDFSEECVECTGMPTSSPPSYGPTVSTEPTHGPTAPKPTSVSYKPTRLPTHRPTHRPTFGGGGTATPRPTSRPSRSERTCPELRALDEDECPDDGDDRDVYYSCDYPELQKGDICYSDDGECDTNKELNNCLYPSTDNQKDADLYLVLSFDGYSPTRRPTPKPTSDDDWDDDYYYFYFSYDDDYSYDYDSHPYFDDYQASLYPARL